MSVSFFRFTTVDFDKIILFFLRFEEVGDVLRVWGREGEASSDRESYLHVEADDGQV